MELNREFRTQTDENIRQGRFPEALDMLRQLWASKPTLPAAAYIESCFARIEPHVPLLPYRVFVARSYTVELLLPLVRAEALLSGIQVVTQVGQFNAYTQEVLDAESDLHIFAPQAVILAVHLRSMAPELWEGPFPASEQEWQGLADRVSAEVCNLLREFRKRSDAHLVVHNFDCPPRVPAPDRWIRRINRALQDAAAQTAGCYVLDYDRLISDFGRERALDEHKWLTARVPVCPEFLPTIAREWVRYLHPLAGKVCKVLVTDLDNTLWGGVVGEDGMGKLQLDGEYPGAAYRAVQRELREVARRGVLLAVASKNNPDDALAAIDSHPDMLLRRSDFACLRINWQDKAENLRAIAAELNLGIESLAFLDDNPVERARIRAALPEVTVIEWPEDPMNAASVIRHCPALHRLALTAEDQVRQTLYAEQQERAALAQQSQSVEDYYRALEQRVTLAPVNSHTLRRTAQLTQKTNQFNMTTRRYSEPQLEKLLDDPRWMLLTASVQDRFGDNGIVGVVMAERDGPVCRIDNLLLSCRVVGRTVETAVLAGLAEMSRARGASEIEGWYFPTAKNAPAREVYAGHGFRCVETADSGQCWRRDLEELPECPPWITLTIDQELLSRDYSHSCS